MKPPNKELAADLCSHLLDATETFRKAKLKSDTDGRTMSLGITMFAGVLLAMTPEEDREFLTNAMQGFALSTLETLRHVKR